MIQPIEKAKVIQTMINLLVVSSPRVKIIALRIIRNLIKIGLPGGFFDQAVDQLENDPSSIIAQSYVKQTSSLSSGLESSKFIKFLYEYLLELRSKIWTKSGLESQGTYAVTAELIRLLRYIVDSAP